MNLRGNRIAQTESVCFANYLVIAPQAFYKKEKNIKEQTQQNLLVLNLVAAIRYDIPELGSHKLYRLLQPNLRSSGQK